MTRFIHIGDIHLQSGHPRNADRLQALDQIVGEGLALEQLGAWLIPGDIFHQRSTADDRNAFAARVQAMATHAPVCLVKGNHDAPGDLEIFAQLKARWPIYVQTRPAVLDIPLPTGEVAAIACLPYPDKSSLVSAGVLPSETAPTSTQLFDAMFMQWAHELALMRVGGAIPLFIGHVNVRGSISSTGQPQIGAELELDRLALARLPAVYCGLNHIHLPQEVGPGVYAGSIARLDHGETEAKSYVVVTCERVGSEWAATYERRPIDVPVMVHVNGALTRDGFRLTDDNDAETVGRFGAGDWVGCDVRVRYRYLASEKSVLAASMIPPLFAGALRLKLEGIAELDRDLRAPEVAAAKTLPEKLAAFAKVERLAPSVADKLARLEQDDPSAFLAHVAARVKAIEFPATPARETVAA